MKRVALVGFSHHLVSPSQLPHCHAGREATFAMLQAMKAAGEIHGAMLLATCNRVEILVEPALDMTAADLAALVTSRERPVAPYQLEGDEVLRHLIRVASSLDSLVIGEDQILAQVKAAWQHARESRLLSPQLDLVLREVLRAAKEIRTQTGIATRPVSIASLATEVLRERYAPGPDAVVAVIGAGEMARKAAHALRDRLAVRVLIVNRTPENAAALAARVKGQWSSLQAFREDPPAVGAVITAVTTDTAVVTPGLAESLVARSPGRRLLLIDLAVPGNVDPACAGVAGTECFCLEDLRAHAERNRRERLHEAQEAERLVERTLTRARACLVEHTVDLASVHRLHEELAAEELGALLDKQLAHLSPSDQLALAETFRRAAARHAHLHLSWVKDRLAAGVP